MTLPVALLTTEQKRLLRRLVGYHQMGRIKSDFTPIPVSGPPSEFVIHILREPSFRFRRISDLDALCDCGLLTFRWNRQGTGKIYTFTREGFQAVETDFAMPPPPGFAMRLRDLMAVMSVGAIVPDGPDSDATIAIIAENPLLRLKIVDQLGEGLLAFTRPHLTWAAFADLERTVRLLRTAVLETRPRPDKLAPLWGQLLGGAIESIPADKRPGALTFLYPLLLIGLARQTAVTTHPTTGDADDRS